mmetsp:Transcript_75539/g.121958  ORF Transcript_75539/g.121958 Transcript_75539/m.121958 type:complete len:83 (+) Transcript_75539:190-438(+)
MSASTSFMPSLAQRSAVQRPIPELAPVITATFPGTSTPEESTAAPGVGEPRGGRSEEAIGEVTLKQLQGLRCFRRYLAPHMA